MQTNNKAKTTYPSSAKTSPPSAPPSHANKDMLIDVDNATVELGNTKVLDGVSLCIHSGEFIGLIGPNGAGKSTLLKAMLGLVPLARGTVAKKEMRIGYIPQRGFMHDTQVPISVLEVAKLGARGDASAARQALEQVGVLDLATKRFKHLSGGQQQRVLIAKALAGQPGLLILDEPTTGIDEQSQVEFSRILAELQAGGMAILMVSHDVDSVLRQVTRVVCLNRSILYDGPAKHFEADRYLPNLYGQQHRVLHHQHEGDHHA